MRFGLSQWVMSAALATAALPACADAVQKIGFIDTERLYRESKDAQDISKHLETEFGSKFKKLRQLEKQGIALQKDLLSGKWQAAEQKRQQDKMAQLNRQYVELKTATDEEFALRRNEEFAAMQMKANKALLELAKAENYDVIVKDVVYVKSEFDVTDRLIKIMNRSQ